MSAHTSPQFPTWTFHLSSCFLGLLTIVLRDRKIPSQYSNLKVLLLHIQKFAITFMNLEVPIGCLKIHRNCLITDILLLEFRNVIQRSFNALKTRSPVLKAAPQIRMLCPKGHSCCCVRFENGYQSYFFPSP
ncbi:hypothetical protein NC651_011178 [Populus alba x Populus x berolinensis]|nr:hypothetical protein NC651_011178 [Populus alba x Populus x berolinensis]